jgi:hypothetical protein
MLAKYAAIHDEAQKHFERLRTGRAMPEDEINHAARGVLFASFSAPRQPGKIPSVADLRLAYDSTLKLYEPEFKNPADLNAVYQRAAVLLEQHEAAYIDHARKELDQHEVALRTKAPEVMLKSAFTLRDAFDQAWVPAKERGRNTVVETAGTWTNSRP